MKKDAILGSVDCETTVRNSEEHRRIIPSSGR